LWLVLFTFACAGDPILVRAEALKQAEAEKRSAANVGIPETTGEAGGVAGEAVVPGIPVEPDPGIPDEPQLIGLATDAKEDGVPGVQVEGVEAGVEGPPTPGVPADPEPGVPEEPEAGTPDEPAPSGITDTGRHIGQAEDPDPGVPEEPQPGQPGSPGGADRGEDQPDTSGPHVTVHGRIDMDESITAKVRIDVFDGDHRNRTGPRPSVVQFHELAQASTFEISIPVSAKRVWIGAYADMNANNRPDRGEPRGWYSRNPVFLNDAQATIIIELVQEKVVDDLGEDFGG
jgi:hypothetical protein